MSWTAQGPSSLVAKIPAEDEPFLDTLRKLDGKMTTERVVLFSKRQQVGNDELRPSDIEVLDFVLKHAGSRDWSALNRLVWSTRPLLAGPAHGDLDLRNIAKQQHEASNSALEPA